MKKFYLSLLLALLAITSSNAQTAKYVFYFIGDGMGVNQVNGTEMFYGELDGKTTKGNIGIRPLVFPSFPHATLITTFSGDRGVTDSAAGGTALSSGTKTYNGAIGVDLNKKPIESIATWAKKSGKAVGIATTVSVDHATPASFYAHQEYRKMYYEIATDLPKAGFDFYAGSGFMSPERTYKKEKARNIFEIFDEAGYTVARGQKEYDQKAKTAQKLIFIQEESADQASLPYAIDRKEGDLTLSQITKNAISFLSKKSKNGFFLMLEGGKIDWACHDNDLASAFRELKDMDDAVAVAYEFYKKHPKETLIVISADHETGGMSLGTGPYALNLKALQYQKQSIGKLSQAMTALRKEKDNKVSWEDMKALLMERMGFWKELPISWENEKKLRDEFERTFTGSEVKLEESMYTKSEPLAAVARQVMSAIALVSWASHGHSDGYVPVFAVGVGSEQFHQRMDNTEIPKCIARAAGYKR